MEEKRVEVLRYYHKNKIDPNLRKYSVCRIGDHFEIYAKGYSSERTMEKENKDFIKKVIPLFGDEYEHYLYFKNGYENKPFHLSVDVHQPYQSFYLKIMDLIHIKFLTFSGLGVNYREIKDESPVDFLKMLLNVGLNLNISFKHGLSKFEFLNLLFNENLDKEFLMEFKEKEKDVRDCFLRTKLQEPEIAVFYFVLYGRNYGEEYGKKI